MAGKVQHDEKKLSLTQFVWLGFNYTVGIAFVGNLAVLSNFITVSDGHIALNSDSVGMHIIWIFVLLGIVASISALAFAKMAKVHKSDNNGGAYLYTRTAFGKFWGFFIVFMQYIILPFLITAQIFNLLKAFFEGTYAGATGMDLQSALGHNGHWASIILDSAGILLYFLFAFVIFGGMKLFKRLSNISGIIKWVTAAFLVIGAIYLASRTNGAPGGHSASDNYHNWFNPNSWLNNTGDTINENGDAVGTSVGSFHFTFNAFTKTFTSCFFFFAGFETFATAGKNIENPDKNLGRGILIIMLISTVFYVAIILIFIAAVDPTFYQYDGINNTKTQNTGFIQNMQMGLWTYDGFHIAGGVALSWVAYGGMALMIISQVALKANVSMQNALYGGTMLQPMAVEGYIPEKYNELNQDNLPVKGSILNFYITAIVLVIWLIIPDLYEGISNSNPVFNVSQLTAASGAITLFIYGIVILSLLKQGWTKNLHLRVIEWIIYPICFVILIVLGVYHYVELFINLKGFSAASDSAEFEAAVGGILELFFVIVSITFALVWYFAYYKPKLKKRLSTPEGVALQKELDEEFVLVNTNIHVLFNKKLWLGENDDGTMPGVSADSGSGATATTTKVKKPKKDQDKSDIDKKE